MPLDPNISLSFQPPQIQSPLAAIGQVQALKNQQLQSQSAQLELQQKQREETAQQGTLQAFRDANGDPDQAIANLYKMGLPQQAMSLQTNRVALQKSLEDARKLKLDNQAHTADMLSRSAQNILDTDPAHRPLAYQHYKSEAEANGWVPQNTLPGAYTSDLDTSLLQPMVKQGQNLKDQAQTAKDLAQKTKAEQDTTGKQRTDTLNTLSGATSPEDFQQKIAGLKARGIPDNVLQEFSGQTWTPQLQQSLQTQALSVPERIKAPGEAAQAEFTQAKLLAPQLSAAVRDGTYAQAWQGLAPNIQKYYPDPATNPKDLDVLRAGMTASEVGTSAHQAVEEKQTQQRIGIEQGRYGLAQQEFERKYGDPLAKVAPADLLRYQAILNGDMPMPSPRSVGGQKTADAVLALAEQQGDKYTESRYLTKKAFKTGNDAQSLSNLTTALGHLERAEANSPKLGDYSLSLFTGKNLSPEAGVYRQDVLNTTEEVGRLIKMGVLPEGQALQMQNNLQSPVLKIRTAALGELKDLLGGRVQGIVQKYRTGTGQDIPVKEFFDQPTQQRMQHFGIGAQEPAASAPAAAPSAGPASAAPALRVGQPVKLRNGKTVTITAVHPDGTFDVK